MKPDKLKMLLNEQAQQHTSDSHEISLPTRRSPSLIEFPVLYESSGSSTQVLTYRSQLLVTFTIRFAVSSSCEWH